MNAKQKKTLKSIPGSIIYTGTKDGEDVPVHFMQYDANGCVTEKFHTHGDVVFAPADSSKIDWYDVRGMHDTKLISKIGAAYDIHPLVLEDVADVEQRPKFEETERGVFMTLRALSIKEKNGKFEIEIEQIAIYFRDDIIISFQETSSDLFHEVRERLIMSSGRIRSRKADYLAYALVDAIVDGYFPLLDRVELNIDGIEERLLDSPDSTIKSEIHHQKRELLMARKSIAPLREAISRFSRSENPFIQEQTAPFLRDLYDHSIHIMDTVDSYRDILNGLQDLFISEVSFKMNQVMQVLTIISVIFIPITFLAGLYGMNFVNIPELQKENGYFIFLGVIVLLTIAQLLFFKRKKWL